MSLGRGFFIGVHSKEEEYEAVKEFFELFKVPYEVFEENRSYNVVLTTQDIPMEVDTHLLLVFSSRRLGIDNELGLRSSSVREGCVLKSDNEDLPIYGRLRTFSSDHIPLLKVRDDSEVAAVRVERGQLEIIRAGYDLFDEVRFLLSTGQPPAHARTPSLDLHISQLRKWIVNAGVLLVEIPPTPQGFDFAVCLTHDVDFIGIRKHILDHTMLGFLYRASLGSLFRFFKGRIRFQSLMANWKAVCLLPAVYLRLIDDYWEQFDRYGELEKDIPSTFYFLPFKDTAGVLEGKKAPAKRGCKYDVERLKGKFSELRQRGCEIGLHAIDAWNDLERAREEVSKICDLTGEPNIGSRTHWLYFDENSAAILERAGVLYDSSLGYNDAVGYRNGTSQIFRPLGVGKLLEVPLHIQDTAMFYGSRMGLDMSEAFDLTKNVLRTCLMYGGVLVINWHLRSLAPERLWDDIYEAILNELKEHRVWFGTGRQIVKWFENRRKIQYSEIGLDGDALRVALKQTPDHEVPSLMLRVYIPSRHRPCEIRLADYADQEIEVCVSFSSEDEVSLVNE